MAASTAAHRAFTHTPSHLHLTPRSTAGHTRTTQTLEALATHASREQNSRVRLLLYDAYTRVPPPLLASSLSPYWTAMPSDSSGGTNSSWSSVL